MGTPRLGITQNMKFPPAIALVLQTVKYLLLCLAAVFSVALLHLLIVEVAIPLVEQATTPNHTEERFHQVEITSIGVSSFETPHDDTTPLRFNLTARVISRHQQREMCVTHGEADVWHDGTPLGKAYFPKTCLEKMTDVAATATTSTELVGLSMPKGTSGGAPVLQVEMTQATSLLSDDRRTTNGGTMHHWVWCKATLGGQLHQSPQNDAKPCRIYHLARPETSDRRFLFPPKK